MRPQNQNAPFWNHNSAFYSEIVDAMPFDKARILDVGCGTGALLSALSSRTSQLYGIDPDTTALSHVTAPAQLVPGDFLAAELPQFDYIVAVASLHHMDTGAALTKMKHALVDGGFVYVLGLHRLSTPIDFGLAALGWLPETIETALRSKSDPPVAMADPAESYEEIKRQAELILPGARMRRRRHYRYSLQWHKS